MGKDTRMARRTDDTAEDRILASFRSEAAKELLSPKELEMRKRYLSIRSLEMLALPDEEIVKRHKEAFEVSRATAYRDLGLTREIFGDLMQVSRQAKRYSVDQLIMTAAQMAVESKDIEGILSAAAKLTKLHRLDQDDIAAVDPEQVQPPTIIIQVGTGDNTRQINLNDPKWAKDIPYKDIQQMVAGEQLDDAKMLEYLNEAEEERD